MVDDAFASEKESRGQITEAAAKLVESRDPPEQRTDRYMGAGSEEGRLETEGRVRCLRVSVRAEMRIG